MSNVDAFQIAWAGHEATERFSRTMEDLRQAAPAMDAAQRAQITTGLLQAADDNSALAVAAMTEWLADVFGRPVPAAIYTVMSRLVDDEAESRARLQGHVRAFLAEMQPLTSSGDQV